MNDVVVANRYRLGRRIGSGGMGRVWLARDEVLRRSVAIKEVLLPEGLTEAEAIDLRRRTLREARAAAILSHPSVIKVFDVMYAEDRPWIVMEYVESRSLAQAIKEEGRLKPVRVAAIGLALLSALRAAHDAGVLHRDIKPGNVLLAEDGRVVLTDFGLATFDDIGAQLTQTGVVHGSPQFIAPERALDGTSTPAADLWSLGATLYAAVEGRAPYSRVSSYATLTALATAPPDPPLHAGPLKPILGGMLRRNPAARMPPDEARLRLAQVVAADRARSIPRQRQRDDASGEVPTPEVAIDSDDDLDPDASTDGDRPTGTRESHRGARHATGARGNGADHSDHSTHSARRERRADRERHSRDAAADPDYAPPSPWTEVGVGDFDSDVDTDQQMDLMWALGEADTESPIGGRTKREQGRRRTLPQRRSQRAAAVVGLMILAAGAVAVAVDRTGTHHPPTAAAASHAPPSPATSPATATWPCAPTPPVHTVAVPSSIPVDTTYGLQPGWIWYTDPAGFEIEVPAVMRLVQGNDIACLYDPTTSGIVGIERWASTTTDSLAALKARMNALNAAGSFPGYRSLGITPEPYLPQSADAEFTYDGSQGQIHAVMHDYVDGSGVAYTLFWATPANTWTIDQPYYPVLTTSFTRIVP